MVNIMGEKSKKIGEIGENIVEKFFSLIGWENALAGQTIDCLKPKKHAHDGTKTKQRCEHGIDFLHSYKSPLESSTIESLVVSVKHSDNQYPNNPKTKFKEYITDIAYAIECFSRSDLKAEHLKSYQGANRQKNTGVLFWLSSNDETYHDVVSRLDNCKLDDDLKFDTIYVVDNRKVEFIFDVISFIKLKFNDKQILFHYPLTSLNYADKEINRFGKSLPVEFIVSPLMHFLLKSKNNSDEISTFCIASIDDFDEDALARLIQAAREYTHEVTCKYLFLFPNYVESHHEDSVIKAKRLFDSEISNQISVMSYNPDYRSLNNG
jgi:hypothetical protein